MIATRSTRTARTENMTAKPAFRGCRATAAAAAVIAFGLLTAPLQAQTEDCTHSTGECICTDDDYTVTLSATLGSDNVITLVGSVSPAFFEAADQQSGFQYRYKEPEDFGWSDWETLDRDPLRWTPFHGNGPYSLRARAWTYKKVDGEWCLLLTDPTDVVTVTPSGG